MLPVAREIYKLLRPAVQFTVPEFDMWLRGREAHGVTTWPAWSGVPERRVREALIHTREAEDAKGEGGQEACFLVFVKTVGGGEAVFVVDESVRGEAGLGDLVEHKAKLEVSVSSNILRGKEGCVPRDP